MIYINTGNNMLRRLRVALLIAAISLLAIAPIEAQDSNRPMGWTAESHGNSVPANYELVLPDDHINEIYISFSAESWRAEEEDMIALYGEHGTGDAFARGGFGGPGGSGQRMQPMIAELAEALDRSEDTVLEALPLMPDFAAVAAKLEIEADALIEAIGLPSGLAPQFGRGGNGAPGGRAGIGDGGNLQLAERNPIWVPVTIQFDDQTWWEVGFRFKGNSTLSTGWRTGTVGLPFKLDFDKVEDDFPELKNQRFFGFKQLSFANNAFDPSLQRERVTADIFRVAGVPAAETSFYSVNVDTGSGAGYENWGLYTALELPDDTLIETQFADDNGNMYKPGGRGASFAAGSFKEDSFDKETNRDSSYDDVQAVFASLHADTRLTDSSSWRSELEAVFNVDGFLRWLATNTLLQNWDTYGVLSHNYYLYADEASGQLVWIPWDNNMALSSTMGRPPGAADEADEPERGPGFFKVLSLPMDEVDPDVWPLIGFLMDDALYRGRYVEIVAEISENVLTPQRMEAIYEANFDMLVALLGDTEGEDAVASLRAATDALVEHVYERAAAAEAFLANHEMD